MQQTTVFVVMVGVAAATGALPGVATVEAQTKLTLSNQTRTVDCGGGTLQLSGRQNTITVTGECRKVDITGAGNIVSIDAVAAIEVTGIGNTVTWRRAIGRATPRVSVTGSSTINRAPSDSSAAPTPAETTSAPARGAGTRRGVAQPSVTATTVTLLEDDREDTIDCKGREVSILGSRNSLRLRGTCPLLIVAGSDNVLDVDTAARVRATGDRNRITWTRVTSGTEPSVENTGTDNRVTKADRPSPPR